MTRLFTAILVALLSPFSNASSLPCQDQAKAFVRGIYRLQPDATQRYALSSKLRERVPTTRSSDSDQWVTKYLVTIWSRSVASSNYEVELFEDSVRGHCTLLSLKLGTGQ